jgi:hypothetical protein
MVPGSQEIAIAIALPYPTHRLNSWGNKLTSTILQEERDFTALPSKNSCFYCTSRAGELRGAGAVPLHGGTAPTPRVLHQREKRCIIQNL